MQTPAGLHATHDASHTELTFTLVAALRAHPHLCNVLTHISSQNWRAAEKAIAALLDPATAAGELSALECNILELLCDDRGVTGRIMRPFFFAVIAHVAGEEEKARVESRMRELRALMPAATRPRIRRCKSTSAPHLPPLIATVPLSQGAAS